MRWQGQIFILGHFDPDQQYGERIAQPFRPLELKKIDCAVKANQKCTICGLEYQLDNIPLLTIKIAIDYVRSGLEMWKHVRMCAHASTLESRPLAMRTAMRTLVVLSSVVA